MIMEDEHQKWLRRRMIVKTCLNWKLVRLRTKAQAGLGNDKQIIAQLALRVSSR